MSRLVLCPSHPFQQRCDLQPLSLDSLFTLPSRPCRPPVPPPGRRGSLLLRGDRVWPEDPSYGGADILSVGHAGPGCNGLHFRLRQPTRLRAFATASRPSGRVALPPGELQLFPTQCLQIFSLLLSFSPLSICRHGVGDDSMMMFILYLCFDFRGCVGVVAGDGDLASCRTMSESDSLCSCFP